MALDRKAVQVRLSDEAYKALEAIADVEGKDLGEKGRELIERALLGEFHAIKLQAARFARLTISANGRKGAQTAPQGADLFPPGANGGEP
jgi:hypothetical protein